MATEVMHPTQSQEWTTSMSNRLVTMAVSQLHYIFMVGVNRALTEVIIDLGGSRFLINLQTTRKLDLCVEFINIERNFRCFQGLGSKLVWYTRQLKGVTTLQFIAKLNSMPPKLKIIQHEDSLFLSRADFMATTAMVYVFKSINYNSIRQGVVQFMLNGRKLSIIAVYWPVEDYNPEILQKNQVQFEEHIDDAELVISDTNQLKEILALVKNRGQGIQRTPHQMSSYRQSTGDARKNH